MKLEKNQIRYVTQRNVITGTSILFVKVSLWHPFDHTCERTVGKKAMLLIVRK